MPQIGSIAANILQKGSQIADISGPPVWEFHVFFASVGLM